MKFAKCNIIAVIRIIIFITVVLAVLLLVVAEPQHGRRFTVHIIDTIVIQAAPPAKKLINYMNKKYDKNFFQVCEEPIFDSDKRHHTLGSGSWGFWYNGITVTTDDDNGEYYHVRDDYGTYLDNYGCYLVNDDAREELQRKVSAVVEDSKVACFPMDIQYKELPAYMTVQEYLDTAGYWLCIVICSEGGDARNDYDKICRALNIKSGRGFMTMHWLNKDEYENIDMNNRLSIINTETYNIKLEYDVHTSEPLFVSPE